MRVVALAMVVALSACEPGSINLVQPADNTGGAAELDIGVVVGDTALASALGWSSGVPDAAAEWAYVQRRRYLFHTTGSDSTGTLRIDPEGPGMHWVAAEKAVEIDGVPRVLGGGLQTRGDTLPLALRLDDPGTVVISEVHMTLPPPWETAGYAYHGSKYIELYNNSEEVRYLDGMVLGVTYPYFWDRSAFGHHPCPYTAQFREDPAAVWSASHWRFPGTGTEFPITPGEAVVVAVSAADHTDVHPSMLDLTDAEFELQEAATADNPAAVNVAYAGTGARMNHFLISRAFWFLSAPVDVEVLPIQTDDNFANSGDLDFRGFPADAIRDVAIMWWDATSAVMLNRDSPPCDYPIHPSFDALPGGYLSGESNPEDLLVSPQRRVVRVEDGRRILLDTNTSKIDFENLPRTPGWIP